MASKPAKVDAGKAAASIKVGAAAATDVGHARAGPQLLLDFSSTPSSAGARPETRSA